MHRIDVEELTDNDAINRGRAAAPPQPCAIGDTDDQGVSDPRGRDQRRDRGRSRPASGLGAITNRPRRRHTTPPAPFAVDDVSIGRGIT